MVMMYLRQHVAPVGRCLCYELSAVLCRQGCHEQLLFCYLSTLCYEKMQQELPCQMLTDHGLPILQNCESKVGADHKFPAFFIILG